MSINSVGDPRTALVREKYFSLRPKPLERWLWRQGLTQAAERVFWLHWEEGMKRGDWCSELSLRQVARECCVDTSTVTRAYQALKSLNLIRRADPGRDPGNPFQQAIAITEVRLPRELLAELGRSPNRPVRQSAAAPANPEEGRAPEISDIAKPRNRSTMTRAQSSALLGKLSGSERAAFFLASRDRRHDMNFDASSLLAASEQAQLLAMLDQLAADGASHHLCPKVAPMPPLNLRRLSPLESARLRKSITVTVAGNAAAEIFRQVLWSVEEGALRRFDSRLAVNIAMKKIREGAWNRPHRMPPNWLRAAATETCSAAS